MKHPALTRVFSIVLALLCLAMAAAGAFGLTRAKKDRQNVLEDMERLRERAASYREVTDLLSRHDSYTDQSDALDEKQSQHSEDSAEHRSELSTYTLTQYGIGVGTEAIDQADLQFAHYKAMFDQAVPSFQAGLDQANALVASLRQIYDAGMGALANANAHLAYANALAASLGAGEGLSFADLTAACDQGLALIDEISAIPGQLSALTPALETIAAFDPESLTSLSEGMGAIPESLGSFGGVSFEGYAEAGSPVDFDLNSLVQLKNIYDQAWPLIREGLSAQEAVSAQLEALVLSATGMSFADLRQGMQDTRNSIAALGDEPIDPAVSDAVLLAYAANSGAILAALDQANATMGEINAEAAALGSALSSVEGQLAYFSSLLAQARQMIAEGETALYWARAGIWYQMGQQREKEEQLREEKERLEEEAQTLQTLSDEAQEQKDAEQRQRSLRAILVKRDDIRSLVEAGEEPDAAALRFAEESESAAETEHRLRSRACLLMLAGAVFGLLCIPAAFEQLRSRFMLLFPVLACFGCAAAAEWTFWHMGRGHSYSALCVVVFALILFLAAAPVKKKKSSG